LEGRITSVFTKGHKVNVGKKCSEEIKEKLRKTSKEKGFQKGHIPVNKGKPAPWAIGNKYCLGKIPWNKGKKHSEETKEKMREAKLKNPTRYWLNRKKTQEHLKKIGEGRKGKYSGENCPVWKGGISFEPYTIDWTNTLKRSIRERDNYTCQECGIHQDELNIGQIKRLDIHHIDYNKKNCNKNNLISLCRNCHTRTSFNRKKWSNYFKSRVLLTTNIN